MAILAACLVDVGWSIKKLDVSVEMSTIDASASVRILGGYLYNFFLSFLVVVVALSVEAMVVVVMVAIGDGGVVFCYLLSSSTP